MAADEVISRLHVAARAFPHLRLGQLIVSAFHISDPEDFENELYYVSDADFVKYIEDFMGRFNGKA